MKTPITVLVLTYNEELNIGACLASVADWADEIIVVDSFSTDRTKEIAHSYGAKFFEHKFINQAEQFNWALDHAKIKNGWILKLDADELVTPELRDEITKRLADVQPDISGFYIKRRVYFMGRWIKHGGYYPTWLLRLFRSGKGRSEERGMDEHIVLMAGTAEKLQSDFIDENKKDLSSWIAKHNSYASREVEEFLKQSRDEQGIEGQAKWKRKIKYGFYYRLPLFFRAFAYFCYRYFLRCGFLDGREGIIFHFLQGCWYRFLVDAKLYELRNRAK